MLPFAKWMWISRFERKELLVNEKIVLNSREINSPIEKGDLVNLSCKGKRKVVVEVVSVKEVFKNLKNVKVRLKI